MRLISEFSCCVSISFRDVASCCSEAVDGSAAMVCHNSMDSSWFSKSLDLYLSNTASQYGCAVSSACWFVYYPYELPCRQFLSLSATTNSPACALSGSISLVACSIECMLLDCELKALEHSEVDPMHGSMRSSGLGGVLPNERLLDDMGSCGPPDMDLQDWVKV